MFMYPPPLYNILHNTGKQRKTMEIIVQHYSLLDNVLDGDDDNQRNCPHNPPSCVICMEKLHNGQEHIGLPCHPSHCFHSECIHKWWNKNKSCPLCRSCVDHNKIPGATLVVLSSTYSRFPYRIGSQCIFVFFVFFILVICFFSFLSCMTLFGTFLTLLMINS